MAGKMGPLQDLFASEAFGRYLQEITALELTGCSSEARRFRPGLDYSVAHYGAITKEARLDAVLSLVDDFAPGGKPDEEKRALWESQDVGGYECYLVADDEVEAEASDVYRMDADDEPLLNVTGRCNALSLVMRDTGVMRFVKYVNAQAPGSRWDVAAEYSVVPLEGDAEEGGAEGEGAQRGCA